MLFANWLQETRKLQMESFGTDPSALEGLDRDYYLTWNNLAARDELSEALSEHSWKPWSSKTGELNRREYIKEQIDVLHFVANMLLAAGCTDEELDALYQEKMDTNRARQAGNYDNTNKCTLCKRALDDVKESVLSPGLCELCVPDVGA
jgi:hypothetical protein